MPFVLTARAENLIRGRNDMADTIRRLKAYAAAGAEVLYAPGLRTAAEIRAVVEAVDRPLNVVTGWLEPGITVADVAAAGAKRISVGGALNRLALAAFVDAARAMKEEGSFAWMQRIADMGPCARCSRRPTSAAEPDWPPARSLDGSTDEPCDEMVVALLSLALTLCPPSARAAEPVDLLLVLAADVSRSVTEPKFKLQREGAAAAITHPEVVRAITSGPNRRIAVCFVEWATAGQQNIVIDWTVIAGRRRRAQLRRQAGRGAAIVRRQHLDQRRHRLLR